MMFSMGNFVTNEPKELCKHTGILQLLLKREGNGISVKEYFVPCYVYDELHGGRFAVAPTDPMLNGGYYSEKMRSVEKYVRERVGEGIDFLPTGTASLDEIADAIGVTLPDYMKNRPVTRLCCQVGPTDRGAVYFSVGGESGYAVRELIRRELSAVITSTPIEGLDCIIVDDVREAFLAAAQVVDRHSSGAKRIMIAGNEGKTLTAQLSCAALGKAYRLPPVKDECQNDVFPWQRLHPADELCISELRGDYPIGIETVARASHPDVLVLTGMTAGLSEVVGAVKRGGLLLINREDGELVRALENVDTGALRVKEFSIDRFACQLPFSDMHTASSVALALATELGVNEDEARTAIKDFKLSSYTRSVVTVDGVKLILNLGARSEASALASVERLSMEACRKICILGGGDFDPEKVAESAVRAGAEYVFALKRTVGRDIAVDGARTVNAECERDLEIEVLKVLKEGDAVLICGSRESGVSTSARRLFGIIDGVIPNSEYRTGDEKLEY